MLPLPLSSSCSCLESESFRPLYKSIFLDVLVDSFLLWHITPGSINYIMQCCIMVDLSKSTWCVKEKTSGATLWKLIRKEISMVRNIFFPVSNQFCKQILEKASVHILLFSFVLNGLHVQCFQNWIGYKNYCRIKL